MPATDSTSPFVATEPGLGGREVAGINAALADLQTVATEPGLGGWEEKVPIKFVIETLLSLWSPALAAGKSTIYLNSQVRITTESLRSPALAAGKRTPLPTSTTPD
ncbi:hypothetical protein [Mangrovihabitans endophyticus]|uniref:hypothetical protein n=1 Tax=Mangrovihabitans endophyticus TaxID=1751298 RepID=UPI00402B8E9F